MSITFGTEGWRAIMAEEFTVEHVCAVTQAIAEHFIEQAAGKPLVLAVGYDTRFLSDHFARAVCEVLAANGITAHLTQGPIPTPAVSRYIVERKLPGGIMITASHNPAYYNGIKIKESFGGSANTDTVASIERRINSQPIPRTPFEQAVKSGRIRSIDYLPDFLKGIRRTIDLAAIKKSRLRVAVDSMHGAGGTFIEQLLAGGKCQVTTLHPTRDVLFGGHAPEPIAKHLSEMATFIKAKRLGLGLATDGDADRLGVLGPKGEFINPGQVLCILLDHLVHVKKLKGPVVKTVSNTSMITRMAQGLGLKLYEVPVGFKHVAKLMIEEGAIIGGEESGGIGVRGYLPERDGVFMGLSLLEALAVKGCSLMDALRDLERRYGRFVYARRDLTLSFEQVKRAFDQLTNSPPKQIADVAVRDINTLDGVKLIGADESWVLFRRSGTEPIVRVYAESSSQPRVHRLLNAAVALVQSA